MSVESPSKSDSASAEKIARQARKQDVEELEKRVHLAELRAREAEAEVRYLVASATRRNMKADKKADKKDSKKST